MAHPVEKRRLILGGALLLTLGLSAWLGLGNAEDGADAVEAAKPSTVNRNTSPRRAEHALALPVLADVRATGARERRAADIFKSHSWFVPPPPPAVKAEVAPSPPPMPFTYLGSMKDSGHTIVFLAKGQRLYTVRKGEVFDGQYRLEDEGGDRIELVYLPLNAKQILETKGAS